ncbi:MAG: hypothetical protein JSS99_11550 [Actinobacteria bacterium]|nr:hypothetical protein [Actinomycetota bacterium]
MAKAKKRLTPGTELKPKRKCCKSRPRCKRCPVTLERLKAMGFAERRTADGRYVVVARVPKRELKEARRK